VSQERLPKRHNRFRDRQGLDAWSVLHTFFNLVGSAVARLLEPVNLSNDELLVLICLAHAGDALSMGEIERSTLLQAGRVRRAVDRLERRRLIAWQRSRTDRRKVLVRTKSPGRQLLQTLSPVMFELIREVVGPMGQESTEFMRAKMRKILSSAAVDAAVDLAAAYEDLHHEGPPTRAPDFADEPALRPAQRPLTWGLAGWLRCCQLSGHVDRIWRREFRNLRLTAPHLQVLAALAGAGEGMTADAIASVTGLPRPVVASTLSALTQAGLVARSGDETQRRAGPAMLTAPGEQMVLDALPMANRLADDLYQGLSDEDLARMLSLLPKLCSSAGQVRDQYRATSQLTSPAPAQ